MAHVVVSRGQAVEKSSTKRRPSKEGERGGAREWEGEEEAGMAPRRWPTQRHGEEERKNRGGMMTRGTGSGTPRVTDGVDDRLAVHRRLVVHPHAKCSTTVGEASRGGANGGVATNVLDREEDWQSKGRERENEMERQCGEVAGNI
uniref:Uncharacterized protein n=1 Tax=Oryza punctata TaxID=4537 RepID=A0A0E0K4M5_ORYPU